ncbi:MAG: Ribosome-binding factor A [Synergistetes bacterium ADurb.BinA166]|nr:MAG: Ribosome-binding factor A [Synergistetes bacterium ADurb.BinA166]
MKERRFQRLVETVRAEVEDILRTGIADPRLGFITITRVKLSPDATHAFIFYSTLGTDDERRQSQDAVESAKGYARRLLAERMSLRTVPELHFIHDTSIEEGEEVLRIMRNLGRNDG